MGWESCFNWEKKKDVVKYLSNSIEKSGWKILGEKGTSEGHWYAVEANGQRFIYLGLIKKSKGELLLKTMDESMGPFYYSCPVKFFDLVPEGNEKWRETVRSLQAKKKVELKEGMKFSLYGTNFTVHSIHQLGRGKNYIVLDDYGQKYRLKRTQLKEIEILGE